MQRINIMTSCDDNLAKFLLPQLNAIEKNLSNMDVHFYLFHHRISMSNINMIKNYADSLKNITFHEIKVNDIESYKIIAKNGGKWPEEAYFSLCCQNYLPDIDRILYIDAGDIIINGDISPFYFDDFEDKSLIVTGVNFKNSPDGLSMSVFTSDDMNTPKFMRYITEGWAFSAGCYVINLEKMRANNLGMDYFINISNELAQNIINGKNPESTTPYVGDQGFITVCFINDVKYFGYSIIEETPQYRQHFSWGVVRSLYMPYHFTWYAYEYAPSYTYTPIVLHYCASGTGKPWVARFSMDEIKQYEEKVKKYSNLPDRKMYAPFFMKHQQQEMCEVWWEYCKNTEIYKEQNLIAKTYAQALQEHYLPLCARYNTLVEATSMMQEQMSALLKASGGAR